MISPVLRDSACLLVLRGLFFYLSMRFLQSSLNPALRNLSKPLLPVHHNDETYDDSDASRPSSPMPTPRSERPIELVERATVQVQHSRSKGSAGTKELGRVARLLFCLCFAEGCVLVSLVVFHIANLFDEESRHISFYISLHVLLTLVLLVIPLVQCMLLTYKDAFTSKASLGLRAAVALVPFGLYCFLFTRIPPYVAAVEQFKAEGWITPSLGRLVVLGVVVLAGLSGYGAVRTAWAFYEHIRGTAGASLSHDDVLQKERSLYQVKQEIVTKSNEISRAGPPKTGWFASDPLRAELRGLEAMHREMEREVEMIKRRKAGQEFGQTLQGRLYSFAGYIFSMYCIARVIMCLPSVFFAPRSDGKGNNGDWISFLLAVGIGQLHIDADVASWSRFISLMFTGVLVVTSLTQILRSLGGIIRLASKTAAAGFLLLSLGQLFSVYIISLLVQLRNSLQQADGSMLISLPEFRVFGRLFDVVFLLSALGSLVYRYIAMKVAQ